LADPAAFRSAFPVLRTVSYLNAGTEGPLPLAAAEAVRERITQELEHGRSGQPFFQRTMELATELRAGYARVLRTDPQHVALTGSTTDGINTILTGLELGSGDEILISDEEHPGLLAPLGRARRTRGIEVRSVPFAELPGETSARTKLIACSHVSWVGGKIADIAALTATGIPVLLDAAQSIGAVPADVHELGVDFYAASGQKWLCGPEGSGCLYVRGDRLDQLEIAWPNYGSIDAPEHALELTPAEGTKRLDHGFPPGLRSAWALASLSVFEAAGWDWVHQRAAELAASLADGLAERGITVAPRGRSTLVSWPSDDPAETVTRLAGEQIVVRSIPAAGLVRASVGAWSSEEELARLVSLAV
jgi:L-cysteine/cystine lyase